MSDRQLFGPGLLRSIDEKATASLPRRPRSEGWAVALGAAGGAFTARRLGVRFTSVQLIGVGLRIRSKLSTGTGITRQVTTEQNSAQRNAGALGFASSVTTRRRSTA